MKQEHRNKALSFINKKRQDNGLNTVDEAEIAEQLKEQFLKDQYIAACLEERKEKAEQELSMG